MVVNPTNLPKPEIEGIAKKIAARLGITPGAPLEPVIARLGGCICCPGKNDVPHGRISVEGPNEFTIFISPVTGNLRDRFTIAHELGHYVLHSKCGSTPLNVNREGSNRAEWEANWFAAALLMPESDFRQKVEEMKSDSELAYHFGVSKQAVRVRKSALGIA